MSLSGDSSSDDVTTGWLHSEDGGRYQIVDGIPDFTYPAELGRNEREARAIYDDVAEVYDQYIHLTFDTFRTTEVEERAKMVDRLNLTPGQSVLEFGCGTGRTSDLIAEGIGPTGTMWLQDLSRPVLNKARERCRALSVSSGFAVSNGSYIPMADRSVDAVFHFGGINMMTDISRCFQEAVRVTKPGGRVVIGDESMPIWLRDTEMGRVLMNSNPHYRHLVPFEHLPVEARDVCCEWIIGGLFYVISFTVGEGVQYADLDFPIPGRRGGTHRTRYYGQLEGVTPEAKTAAIEAAAKVGESVHDWLDGVVRDAAGLGRNRD